MTNSSFNVCENLIICLRRSEVRSQVDSVSERVERVERELEYLENKMPAQTDIEMEGSLLEQQIQAAELDLQQKKAKIRVENGRNGGPRNIKDTKCTVQVYSSVCCTLCATPCSFLSDIPRLQNGTESNQVSQDCEEGRRHLRFLVQGPH